MRARYATAFEAEYFFKYRYKKSILSVRMVPKGTSKAKTTYDAYQQKKTKEADE
tara:strand:- start:834 stop:995 length:162 start_codon:yes stop_codon:yes gene_type:complete